MSDFEPQLIGRLFKVGFTIVAGFAFTILMMYGSGWRTSPRVVSGPISYLCAHAIWPGMAIVIVVLRRPLLGDDVFPLSLTFNTLLYSVLFGYLFTFWRGGRGGER